MPRVEASPETYCFRLEFLKDRSARVHEVTLAHADFDRAVEATFFDGLRRGAFTDYDPQLDRARIEPSFVRSRDGSPRTHGFTVVLPTPSGGEHRQTFDILFFKGMGRRIAAELAVAGRVPDGSTLHYQLAAYRDEADRPAAGGLAIELEAAAPSIPIAQGSRKAFGTTQAWDQPTAEDFPVLLPRHVLQEAVDEARRAPEREVGGVLLGHLRRESDKGDLFLEVTCLVPAEETQATDVSVTFTHATWARVREVAAWRGEGEIFVGWVHSHPFRFCAECPLPVPAECVAKVLFYSSDDEFLMETSFARPFMVGLLSAVEPRLETALGHLPVRLFGWKNGAIEARGFEVIDV
jgi:proteasome lid subunit RPN8/RPN11